MKRIKKWIRKYLSKNSYFNIRVSYWNFKNLFNVYEKKHIDFLRRNLKKGSVCIDVGANLGQYAVRLSKIVGPSGKVFAFEPVKDTFRLLTSIVEKTALTNIKTFNFGLGEKTKIVKIYMTEVNGEIEIGLSHLSKKKEQGKKSETVKIRSLDEVFKENFVHSCDFIKIDVEGSEYEVIRGATYALRKFRPILLIEASNMIERMGHTLGHFFRLLKRMNYEPYILEDGVLVKAVRPFGNRLYYFKPVQKIVIPKEPS